MKGVLLAIHHEIVPTHLLCVPNPQSSPICTVHPYLHFLALYRRVAPKTPESKATAPQTTGANDHCGTRCPVAALDVLPDVEVGVTCPLPAVAVPVDGVPAF